MQERQPYPKKYNKKIDILYIVSIMPPFPGGAAVDFDIITSTLKDYNDKFRRIVVLTERGCKKEMDDVLQIKDVLYNYDSASRKSFFKQLINYLVILFYILFTPKDIIHIHARYVYAKYIGRIIWLALLISPSKVVIDIRDRFYCNFGFGHHYIVCSEDLLDYYSWINNKYYVPVPLNLPEINKNIKYGHKIAYIGTIVANKGILELLNGYRQYVNESRNPLELHFWGLNNMGDRFIREIEKTKNAKYCGYISNDEIFSKILEYKAIILPSKSEGLPRTCLEAMYCNRIIVCHRSIRTVVEHIPEEFIFDDATSMEIKNKLFIIESYDKALSYDYDFNVHSPERVANKLIEFYSNIQNVKFQAEWS